MKKKALMVLVALNIVLALLIMMGPIAAQIFPSGLKKDCCVGDECLRAHCWIVHDCEYGQGDCFN